MEGWTLSFKGEVHVKWIQCVCFVAEKIMFHKSNLNQDAVSRLVATHIYSKDSFRLDFPFKQLLLSMFHSNLTTGSKSKLSFMCSDISGPILVDWHPCGQYKKSWMTYLGPCDAQLGALAPRVALPQETASRLRSA